MSHAKDSQHFIPGLHLTICPVREELAKLAEIHLLVRQLWINDEELEVSFLRVFSRTLLLILAALRDSRFLTLLTGTGVPDSAP
jgi:hypothetical protein